MPLYEYRCQECQNHFEAIVSSSQQRDQTRCPRCDSDRVQRVISAASFRVSSAAGACASPGGPLGGCSSPSGFS
ncbi:MAG: zinc ribbon domain-containing protein [Desulfurivibrio sp.]|nr:zinc ribbon domain-containing protein [Desulfurivibrio sp.]